MDVLIACEESQTACIEFRKLGHNAFSCDIQRCSGGHPDWHIFGSVFNVLHSSSEFTHRSNGSIDFFTEDGVFHSIDKWDLIIAHPPCTNICSTSSVAFSKGLHSFDDIINGLGFFSYIWNLQYLYPNLKICIENPKPMRRSCLPPFSQTIQPYQFGDNYTKLTCLWLYNLPYLIPNCYASSGTTRNICPSYVGTHFGSISRSKSFKGIAEAMAKQWS